jgi:tRNA threonylcarbamoyl adenosine modification protein (Sua5/YciO/YrdC/YwlC family)
MLISIHPSNPQLRNIQMVVDCLKKGGVIIYPTDTIYALGCSIFNNDAITRIARIKNLDPKKAQFSIICNNLSHLTDYAKSVDTPIFRLLKAALPGPYTFILNASKQVPKQLKTKKETVGIRVPDNKICMELVAALGTPLMSTSLPMDEEVEYYTDPEVMNEKFGNLVDMVVDGGIGNTFLSTIIDCTDGAPHLVREGAGRWEHLI